LLEMNQWLESTLQDLTIMQRKEGHQCRLNGGGEEKCLKQTRMRNYQTILLIYYQLIWIHGITMYAIVYSTIYTEFIRNTSKMAEY
jgi:hypothetical protein